MNEDGLAHRMGEEEHKLPWSALQSFEELKGGFQLVFQEPGAAFILYHAFDDAKERRL